MGQIQSIEEFIGLMLRRRWLILAITFAGLLAAVVYAKSRPSVFETAAVIQIEGALVTEPSANGTQSQPDGGGAAQILQTIEQRLTTREALTAMIERHGLFADLPDLPIEKKIFALRSAVTFQAVDSAAGQNYGQARNISAIIVFARFGDADLAARIANDFAQGILDQSTAGQRARADQNVAFFKEEEARTFDAINALESEIAAYKNLHADALPTLTDARRDELVSLTDDIRAAELREVALAGERAAIDAKQNQRETDKRRLSEIAVEVDVLNAQIAASNARKSEVEALISTTPEVERVLSGFERQLAQLQEQYNVITQRMAESETTQRLAERQQSGRFTLLERAITPEYPLGGGKKKIAVAGALVSLAAALALAFVLDLLNPVVRTAAQMQRQLDLEPVVCIPEIRSPKGPIGSAALRLIDDPARPIFGLPRFAVLAAGTTVALIVLAALIS